MFKNISLVDVLKPKKYLYYHELDARIAPRKKDNIKRSLQTDMLHSREPFLSSLLVSAKNALLSGNVFSLSVVTQGDLQSYRSKNCVFSGIVEKLFCWNIVTICGCNMRLCSLMIDIFNDKEI